MRFLPIVARELIEASRRRSTHRARLGVAVAGLAVGGFVFLVSPRVRPGELGLTLFVPLAVVTYAYCLLGGVFRTADCLSEEKREGTLGLLFLTDLKGYDIVLGKLVATSLNSVYGLLAIFPIMAVPVLAGGVTIDEVQRVTLVALNNLFFSLALGMFCSAISRDERKALALALGGLLFCTAGLPLLGALLHEGRRSWDWAQALILSSPAYPCFLAFDSVARKAGQKNFFVASVIVTHLLSWLLLALACVIVPRTWQDRAASPGATRRRAFWSRLAHGSAAWRLAVRRRLLEVNPVLWLSGRDRLKVFSVWAFLGLGAFIWALGLLYEPHGWKDTFAYVWTAIIVHTVLKCWLATEASRRFSRDRQSGALELLLSTSISVKEIVRGQVQALEKQFAGPIFVVLLMDFVFLMADRRETSWVYFMGALMVVLLADMIALAWVGMWRGLNSRNANRAASATVVRIMALPWVIFIVGFIVIGVFGSRSGGWDEEVIALIGLALALGVNLVFALPARQRLLSEFRTVATTRFEKKD